MCLILVAWQTHPDFPLVVAANRDEFHARPTAPLARWADDARIVAGRDLEAGGTWLGITETGRFAAITNVREPGQPKGRLSRGALTADFLRGDAPPADYAAAIDDAAYSGYNLLLADHERLCYRSNRDGGVRVLPPGIYGVSNHLLDTPWPKLATAKAGFAAALQTLPETDGLFAILADREIVPDARLPATGVPLEWERLLSAIFVCSPTYGTRASTVVMRAADGRITAEERSFAPDGSALQSSLISTGV